MASQKQYRSDVMLIAQRLKLSKDHRLEERHVDFMIAKHRAAQIYDDFKANNGYIDPSVLQDFGRVLFTQVLSSDDPAISQGSVQLGKLTIPQVVSLPGDNGIYRVTSTSKFCPHFPISMDMFFNIPEGSWAAKDKRFFRVNTALYISPATQEGNVVLILDDPMAGVVLLTEEVQSGNLTIGVSYTVQSGQVVHNGVTYNVGQAFVAVNNTFTGTGVVKFTTQKRAITENDNYPMSFQLAEKVFLKMFYQEFQIEAKRFADAKNDAANELLALQPTV